MGSKGIILEAAMNEWEWKLIFTRMCLLTTNVLDYYFQVIYTDIIISNLFSSNLQDVVINAQIIYDDDDDGQINQAMMLLCTCLFP